MGPLPIALSTLPHTAYNTIVALLVVPFLLIGIWHLRPTPIRAALWVPASLWLVAPWTQFATKGHADDALVLVGIALAVSVKERSRPLAVLVGAYTLALLAKPTAVVMAPLFLGSTTGILLALATPVLLYLPFFIASPQGFLLAGKGVMAVNAHSAWGELGLRARSVPGWLRPSQFALALAGATYGAVLRQPALSMLLAVTIRSMLEMNPAPSYVASVVALALLADLRTPWSVPVLTIAAHGAFISSQPALDGLSGWPRILWHVAVIVLAIVAMRLRQRELVTPEPQPDPPHLDLNAGNAGAAPAD